MRDQICEFIPDEKQCSYLSEERSLFRYYQIENCSNSMYLRLLERGWRRFGRYFFSPICNQCEQCISVRTLVDEFEMTKNRRRIMKKNSDLQVMIQRPTVSLEHLSLYDRYHQHMHEKKNWEFNGISLQLYFEMFVEGYEEFGYEFLYFDGEKLIGVGLVDILDRAISAVYFFYDPDYEERSLGTYSILKQLDIGKSFGIPHFYPGYWIKNHPSMGYKERFRPFEILQGRPGMDEPAKWLQET